MKDLPKAYEPQKYEEGIYKRWEDSGFFAPEAHPPWVDNPDDPKRPYFSIVLPPPNVTGTLHMGHAAMLAIEDVMIRYHRMKGDRTLWVPGTDHAAIATQTKVEKLVLEKEGKTRHDLGREEFLRRVGEFAQASHDTIINQTKKMGASLDWSREAFTLDRERNLAVNTVFKKMYDDGLIYRGDRIVNWCPRCQSTLADDEVEYTEENGRFYWLKYGPFVLATTRPETKLGDTAVAVHPSDKRYKKMIGKKYMIPGVLGEFEIEVVADEAVDPEFGTGAVKVTPAHSFTDYEIAKRHNLPLKKIINEDGRMMEICGKYSDMTTREAREAIVKDMQKMGLIDHIEENYKHNLSICYRCGTVVEPLPSLQWFVDVNKRFNFHSCFDFGREDMVSGINGVREGQDVSLKELMQTVVRNGQIKIIPEKFEKTYFHWINNLRDWCISRQIWYGHQIPVWYKGEEIYVGLEAPVEDGWRQDTDTLDTWFSSGLWTFSTLGWATAFSRGEWKNGKMNLGEKSDLYNYHPTSVLETGYDILFFWVARMILMTTYTLGEIPFEKIYLHGLVRDEKGRKMSKTLDNTIDPLDMINKYGTDATRLSLLLGNTPGNDMKLSEAKVEGFRNFANKLWNISRFILLNIAEPNVDAKRPETQTLSDGWILSRLEEVVYEVTIAIESYNFSVAGEKLRDFTWSELADWYLEIAKIENNKSKILNYILNTILKLWHPFMPFVTEAIWQEVYGEKSMLLVEKWPGTQAFLRQNKEEEKEVEGFFWIKEIVEKIRSVRADYNIAPAKKLKAALSAGKKIDFFQENKNIIENLARLESLEVQKQIKGMDDVIKFICQDVEVLVDLSEALDLEKEKARLEKEIDTVGPYVVSLQKKLENEDFVNNAPEKVVEAEKKKLSEAQEKLAKLEEQLTINN